MTRALSAAIACTCRSPLRRSLPADAEAQEVRSAQDAQITPGVVEPEPEVPPPVRQPATHRDAVLGEAPRALGARQASETDVVHVVVGMNRVAGPGRQREPRVADVRAG